MNVHDHAAALGGLGRVSGHNVNTRWALPCFYATNLIRGCNNLVEI